MRLLYTGCKDVIAMHRQLMDSKGNEPGPKEAVLDFFGMRVKAHEMMSRYKELAVLHRTITAFADPTQFR